MITVYTTGVFDILHRGHLNVLVRAKELGDYLVVGVQADEGVYKSKGQYPALSTLERMAQLESLPFVDEVRVYENVDQRPYLEAVKPRIMVQGDDWLNTGERGKVIEYLKANDIRLVLIPYTQGISSREIKRRVLSLAERSDKDFILNRVRLRPMAELKFYERPDEEKVSRLAAKIRRDGCFFNPVTVTEHDIVIDGVNRIAALKRLDALFVTCLTVDYKDVDLVANVHYRKDGKTVRMSEFGLMEGERITFPRYSKDDILQMVMEGKTVENGATWHRVKCSVVRLRIPLDDLRTGCDFTSFLEATIDKGNIRYYAAGTYICDEWDS